jgi:uncharacterized protein (DUF1778 family)
MSATTEPKPQPRRSRKDDSIDVRVTAATKALLAAAAAARHTNLSEFVLNSAVREAENTLADRRVFQVSDENWSAFMAILVAPAGPDPDLVALARSRAPWSR